MSHDLFVGALAGSGSQQFGVLQTVDSIFRASGKDYRGGHQWSGTCSATSLIGACHRIESGDVQGPLEARDQGGSRHVWRLTAGANRVFG